VSSLNQVPDPEVPAKARMRRWSAAEKARILAEYESLGKADKGALLRREGIYSSLISATNTAASTGPTPGMAWIAV
jgi:transposase-like protein